MFVKKSIKFFLLCRFLNESLIPDKTNPFEEKSAFDCQNLNINDAKLFVQMGWYRSKAHKNYT